MAKQTRPGAGAAAGAPGNAPQPLDGVLTEEQAREQLAELTRETAGAKVPRVVSLAEALNPEGLNVLGVALLERALPLLGAMGGVSTLLAVLWATTYQDDDKAITTPAEALMHQAAALGRQVPLGELRGAVERAEQLLDRLPGATGYTYTVEVATAADKPQGQDLLAILEPHGTTEDTTGGTWVNTTRARLVVRRRSAEEGLGEAPSAPATASS